MKQRPERLPYPGLRAFDRDEADLFFGRDGSVNEMVDKLAETGFLAVIGASGTGKSSLVRTGLLDGLELGLHPTGTDWSFAVFMPGGQPITNLARALIEADAEASGAEPPEETDDNSHVAAVEGMLRRGPQAVREWLDQSALDEDTHLLLLVDQFEELFRFDTYADREDAEAFVNLLIQSSLPEDRRIHVVITMRSEFLGACALIPRLAETLNRGSYLTPRMSRRECQMAITGPAKIVGAQVEEALVTRLLNDLSTFAPWGREANSTTRLLDLTRRADQLPVMQHLLNRMWLQSAPGPGDRKILTLAQYTDLNGLKGALDAHGDEVFAQFDADEKALAERMFRALVDGPNPAAAVRRPRSLAGLAHEIGTTEDQVLKLIAPFRAADCNFLRPGMPAHGEPDTIKSDTIIDISHESLIRQWGRMSGWVEAEARAARDWDRLATHQRRYAEGKEELLTGRALTTLSNWWQDEAPQPEWAARYIRIDEDTRQDFAKQGDEEAHILERFAAVEAYLKNSVQDAAQEENRKAKTRRWFRIAGGTVTVLSLAVGIASFLALKTLRDLDVAKDSQYQSFLETVGQVVRTTTGALENEFRSPTQSKLETIEFGTELMAEMEKQQADRLRTMTDQELADPLHMERQRLFREQQLSFLINSIAVKLSGGMPGTSDPQVQTLEALLAAILAEETIAPGDAIRLTEAELLLARLARLRTDFDKAAELIARAEARLTAAVSARDADRPEVMGQGMDRAAVYRAKLLYEQSLVHFDQRQVASQLEAHNALRAHINPLLAVYGWQRIKHRYDPSLDEAGREALKQTLREVHLVSVNSAMAALVAFELVDGHLRGGHDPKGHLRDVKRWVDWLVENVGITDPETRMATVRLSLIQAVAARRYGFTRADMGLRDQETLPDPTVAVDRALALVEYDPTNIEFLRYVVRSVLTRAAFALEARRMEQAKRDIQDARTLIHALRELQADPRTLLEATAELEYIEWQYQQSGNNPEAARQVAARLRARALFHEQTGVLHPSVHAEPRVRMTAAHVASGRAMSRQMSDTDAAIAAALARFPLQGTTGDDRYHALKRRQIVYDSILAVDIGTVGADRWLAYQAAAANELTELASEAPSVLKWRKSAMRWASQGWTEYWVRGGADAEQESFSLLAQALEHAIELFLRTEGRRAKIAYLNQAAGFASDLVQGLHRVQDPGVLTGPLKRLTSEVLRSGIDTLYGEREVQFDSAERPDLEGLKLALAVAQTSFEDPETDQAIAGLILALQEARDYAAKIVQPGVDTDSAGGAGGTNPTRRSEDVPNDPTAANPASGGPSSCGTTAWIYEPLYAAPWRTLSKQDCETALNRLATIMSPMLQQDVELIREAYLPFYDNGRLLEVQLTSLGTAQPETRLKTFLIIGDQIHALNGSVQRILDINNEANDAGVMQMDSPEAAAAYLRFFLTYVNGSEGAFQIVEGVRDLAWERDATPSDIKEARDVMRPMVLWQQGEQRWRAKASIHYGGRIYHADLSFGPDGLVDMTNDTPVTGTLPIEIILVNARDDGRGIREFGLPQPGEQQLAINDVDFFKLLGISEEEVVPTFEKEVLAVVRASVVPSNADVLLRRPWLEEYVALISDDAVLDAHDIRARVRGNVADMLARNLPKGDPLLADAVRFARYASEQDPRVEAYMTTLGLALLRAGSPEQVNEAIIVLERVIGPMEAQWMDAYVFLAQAYLSKDDPERAKALLDRAREMDPADRRNRQELRRQMSAMLDVINGRQASQ